MNLTRTRFSRLLRVTGTAVAVLIIAAYAGYRSLPYIRGPIISVFQPVNGSTISTTTATVIGRADRVNSLSLDGNPTQIDESGNFKQTLIIFPGANIIYLDATDQFKRSTHAEIRVFGTR